MWDSALKFFGRTFSLRHQITWQILTKIFFVVFCAEMLQRFSPTIFTNAKTLLTSVCFFHETLQCENKLISQGVLTTQPTKSKSLIELFKERVIVNCGDYFCYIHIFSAKLLTCSQTFVNLKYIQKLEISYEFDVLRLIFTPMYRGRICHDLLTVQNTHRRPLLFIDNRHFIGFLHKQK